MRLRVELLRYLARLQIISAPLVILNVSGDQNFLSSVIRAALDHINIIILENNFCIHALQADRADAQREIVVDVISFSHE